MKSNPTEPWCCLAFVSMPILHIDPQGKVKRTGLANAVRSRISGG